MRVHKHSDPGKGNPRSVSNPRFLKESRPCKIRNWKRQFKDWDSKRSHKTKRQPGLPRSQDGFMDSMAGRWGESSFLGEARRRTTVRSGMSSYLHPANSSIRPELIKEEEFLFAKTARFNFKES